MLNLEFKSPLLAIGLIVFLLIAVVGGTGYKMGENAKEAKRDTIKVYDSFI
jgi:hypothetical protein